MKEKREEFVGIRFTTKEKQIIDSIVERRNSTLAEFIRESIFTHIYNLENYKNEINLKKMYDNVRNMKSSLDNLFIIFREMKKELDPFYLQE